MKKLVLAFVFLTAVLVFTACSKAPAADAKDDKPEAKNAVIPMIMVGDKYYYDTGKESTAQRTCGTPDGKITSTVEFDQKPTQNNQSNFGIDFEYQYGEKDTIDVLIDDKYFVFEYRTGDGSKIKFRDKMYNTGDLSQETIEWIGSYHDLSAQEQQAVTEFPSDLAALLEE